MTATYFCLLRCVCETQMPPMMANSNDGQNHKDKDKYLFTRRKVDYVQYGRSCVHYLESRNIVNFLKIGQMSGSKGINRAYHKEKSCEISKL